jgi:biopolymer transport protein ExbD
MKRLRQHREQADLDITGLLNIMIVLVPVLLMSLAFSQITVLNLRLPEGGSGGADLAQEEIELVIRGDRMEVNFPRGTLLKTIPQAADRQHDFALLSLTLQEIKRLLADKHIEKTAITLLSEPATPYQTIVTAMDTVRSFQAVVGIDTVAAELFPEIAFGDAPPAEAKP